ncbi:MAG: lysine N(6)-hydroxylase/L-ornithine N(5)-oxygenase family protein [Angustibacter sp.]
MGTPPRPAIGDMAHREHRTIGIGAGPANLSLAALLSPSAGAADDVFLERNRVFRWHPGLMLPDAEMQVHFLKDLVTPVDPTNPYSYLAFAVNRRRLYRLLATRRHRLRRKEFEEYCGWVAGRLPSVRLGVDVHSVDWQDRFVVSADCGELHGRNLVIAAGVAPRLPSCLARTNSARISHASTFVRSPARRCRGHITVVGGGQSGAEVVAHLLAMPHGPRHLTWATRRTTFLPLDESPFVEDFFTPEHSRHFFDQPPQVRSQLLAEQRLASDGISTSLLERVYALDYDIRNGVQPGPALHQLPAQELVAAEDDGAGALLTWRSVRTGSTTRTRTDYVVCATGYEQRLPPALDGLRDRLALDDGLPVVRQDFSIEWDGPDDRRIYVQNLARHAFGVPDPNLSLLAWRAAVIARGIDPLLSYDVLSDAEPADRGGQVTLDLAAEPAASGGLPTVDVGAVEPTVDVGAVEPAMDVGAVEPAEEVLS